MWRSANAVLFVVEQRSVTSGHRGDFRTAAEPALDARDATDVASAAANVSLHAVGLPCGGVHRDGNARGPFFVPALGAFS